MMFKQRFISTGLIWLAVVILLTPGSLGEAQAPGYAEILSPSGGEAISGVFTIFGSASHPSFLAYRLSFTLADDTTGTWFLLGESQTNSVVDGGLGLWDTTGISDGNYHLRLEVFLENDQILTAKVEGVRIRNGSAVETSTPAPVAVAVTETLQPPTKTPRPTPLAPETVDGRSMVQNSFITGAILGLVVLGGSGLYLFMRRRTRQRLGMMQMRRLLRDQERGREGRGR